MVQFQHKVFVKYNDVQRGKYKLSLILYKNAKIAVSILAYKPKHTKIYINAYTLRNLLNILLTNSFH